jgi:Protein of unknown function (DUF2490)
MELWFRFDHRTNGIIPFNSSLSAARFGMNYHTKTGFRITGGYAWFGTFVSSSDRIWLHENRLFQQVQYGHKSGKINFVHRFRAEQRWRQMFTDVNQNQTKTFQTNRYRYLLQVDVPLSNKQEQRVKLRWQVANEYFIHNKEEVGYMLFDQNRTLAGLLITTKEQISLAVLYQLIIQQQPFVRETFTINSIRITLFHQLDFRKKKTILIDEVPVLD